MGIPFDLAHIDKLWFQAHEYFFQHVLSWAMAAQIVVIGCTLLLAHKASRAIRAWVTRQQAHPEASADSLAVSPPPSRIFFEPTNPSGYHFYFGDSLLTNRPYLCANLCVVNDWGACEFQIPLIGGDGFRQHFPERPGLFQPGNHRHPGLRGYRAPNGPCQDVGGGGGSGGPVLCSRLGGLVGRHAHLPIASYPPGQTPLDVGQCY